MSTFQLFVEGKADSKFLQDYVQEVFNISIVQADVVILGSWSGYKKEWPRIRQNMDAGIQNILILDADNDAEQRRINVSADFEQWGLPVQLFLLPGDKQTGNLESLLAAIAVDRSIMDCFLEYEKCVNGYAKPLNDARIYSYLDMLLHPSPFNEQRQDMRKEEFRNYRNPAHWNLQHDDLAPLKTFLAPFFQ
jgi:hypothetical protein